MNGLMSMIGMQTEMEYQMSDFPFGLPRIRFNVPKGDIPSDKQKCQPKAQYAFTIKGVNIMASSKKDAIKKYNHRKKVKRMNKLEYIPGDLVMVKESALQFAKDKIFKVISSLSGGFLKVIMLNDSSTTYSISNNAIRPIPLTPEILKKNGWEKLYEKFFEKNVNNIRLTIELSENIYVAINRIFIMEIHYIHELQHLLFGLGLKHEMEV